MSNATQAPQSFELNPRWILAGRAIFTVSSPSGESYTYQVRKAQRDDEAPVWFASLLTGPDNESDYTYIGMIKPDYLDLIATKASKLGKDSIPFRVLDWALWHALSSKPFPDGYKVDPAGRCARCGRTLTVTDGVSADGYRFGFGPECWRKIQRGE